MSLVIIMSDPERVLFQLCHTCSRCSWLRVFMADHNTCDIAESTPKVDYIQY